LHGEAEKRCGYHFTLLRTSPMRTHVLPSNRANCIGAELADEVSLDQTYGGLREHGQHVGCAQAQQDARDRRFQQKAGAWVQRFGLRHAGTAAFARISLASRIGM
jgi:hypothetical protein